MQVKLDQLFSQFKSQPIPIVWLTGDESLLLQEACDEVRKLAKASGFLEREVLDVQSGFDWNKLSDCSNSLSLFAEKKLIDLRLPSAKLDNAAKKALQEYTENPSEDNVLLISSPKIEKASMSAKWFKAIESKASVAPIWPVSPQQLPGWIAQRLKKYHLTAEPEAIQVLVERVEGNLLAAAQEIEKLSMLTSETHLSPKTVAQAVADNARFNVFALIDSALAGNSRRALNILYHLKAEGGEPLQILNMLCREIRSLSRMSKKIEQGQHLNGVMQTERVWKNRMQIVGTALTNHNTQSLVRILKEAHIIDQSVKGLLNNNPWDELLKLVMNLAGTHTCLASLKAK